MADKTWTESFNEALIGAAAGQGVPNMPVVLPKGSSLSAEIGTILGPKIGIEVSSEPPDVSGTAKWETGIVAKGWGGTKFSVGDWRSGTNPWHPLGGAGIEVPLGVGSVGLGIDLIQKEAQADALLPG